MCSSDLTMHWQEMLLGENWSQASKQMFVITDVKFLYYMV